MQQFVAVGALRLHVETFGEASGPCVLLVMGNSAPGLVWPDAFCAMLAATGCFVVRFDQRDTGLSSYLDFDAAPYDLDDLAADALGVLDALGITRAHVVGLSQGGTLAYRLAAAEPGRVRSVSALMSSPDLRPKNDAFAGHPPREGELPRPAAAYVEAVIALNAMAPADAAEEATRFVENFRLAGGPRSAFDEVAWQALGRAVAELPARRPDGRGAKVANHSHHAKAQARTPALLEADLRALRVPVLVLHGACDPIFPARHAEWAAEVIPGARLRLIPEMGHALDPAYFQQVVRELVAFFTAR